jgi:PAS domain S-box-containing protein
MTRPIPPTLENDALLRLAAIVESSDDAIISKNLSSIITSWNRGAERIFGYTSGEMVGRSITVLIPANHLDEEPEILGRVSSGERVEHFETIRQRKDGTLVEVSLSISPIRDSQGDIIGAAHIARDISGRRRDERLLQQQRLRLERIEKIARQITQDLDLERVVQAVTDAATELCGAQFGAFFYNVLNAAGESYMLYTLSGAPRSAFENFGMPRNTEVFDPTFRGSAIVRSDDIRSDPRYGHNAPHHGMPKGHLPVVSYLAVPVIGRSGEVLGGLFFGHKDPCRFSKEAEEDVASIAAHAAIAITNARLLQASQGEALRRRRSEEALELLLQEIHHRVKNTLGIIQAIVSQTFKSASPEERKAFGARLQALSRAQDLLVGRKQSAMLSDVIQVALQPFAGEQRVKTSGPDGALDASKALLLTLILHELATNAVKYGSLSNDNGTVSLEWDIPDGHLRCTWREMGGPAVDRPTRKGFGSVLIERALANEQGEARVDYNPEGLVCRLNIPV